MNENRKGLFTGIKEIFSFTAMQTIKGKGFISSTVVIGIIIVKGLWQSSKDIW